MKSGKLTSVLVIDAARKLVAVSCLVVVSGLCWAESSQAYEFAVVGARAAGMGGAGVAVTTDAYATHWNPAGLAMSKTIDIRVQVSGQAVNRGEYLQTLDDISQFDPAASATAQSLVDKINSGGSLSAVATGGLYFKGYFGEHAFGFNVSDVANAGSYVSQRFAVSGVGPNTSISGQLAVRGLEQRQAAFSYAYAFADKTFSIGMTGKLIQGAAYTGTASVTGGQDVTLSDNFGKAKTSTGFSVDVGAMYRPSSWLRFGIVAKDLTQPEFDAPDGSKFKLDPLVRGGVAVNPWETLTITVDGDFTKNRTFVPGISSRVISLGAEQTLFSELLSLRLGAYKNVADASSYVTPTAGFGFRLWALRGDVAAGYDFREGGALVSGSLGMTF